MQQVLIIDDDELVRQAADLVLGNAGYLVRTAKDGVEGWEMLRSARPEVVLLDVEMPGVSGLDLLQRLRASGRRTKVIMLTGRRDAETVGKAKDLGVEGYIIKPFTPETLLRRVKGTLGPARTTAYI